MQIEINGQRNITLDFDAPKKFKLLKDGAEVPYIRTGKNSFRLGKGIDGVVELEEIIEKPKIVKPMQLQPQQMALVNPNDVIMINQAAQQLEIEQGLLAETQQKISYTQEYLDIQQQRINEAVADVQSLETDNAERITATEGGIFKLAGEIANVENNANEGINSVFEDVEAHKRADNPHNITKKTIGLDKVDNTADMDKPVSKAVKKALEEKADKSEIEAIREEIGEYQEKNEKISNALSSYTGGLAGANDHRELNGRDFPNQHPIGAITGLQNALDGKVSKTDSASKVYGTDEDGNQTTYDLSALGSVNDVQVNGESIVEDHIANLGSMALEDADDYSTKAVADTLYAEKSYEETINNHVLDKNNPHEVTKSQVGLGNVDNTSDLNKPISTATQTVLNGKADKATTLAGYGITDAYTKTEVDTALSGKQNNLDTTQMAAVNSGANTTNIGQIATNTNDIGTINGKIPSAASSSNQMADKSYVDTADNNLQSQIDAIVSSSDVFDIVGTYAELQAYDISTVPVNDIIKVLVDSTHSNAATYYRCVESGGVKSWSYIGSEGAYYTKSETDTLLQAKQNEITSSNKLSADLVDDTNSTNKFVTASEKSAISTALQPADLTGYATETWVGNQGYALSSSLATVATTGAYSDLSGTPTIPTVNNATLTITQGGTIKGTFTANASSDVTIALDAGGGGGGGSYTAGDGIIIDNDEISVDAESIQEVDVEEITEVTLATVATSGAYADLTGKPTVDQTYNSASTNAQSGTAVAEAITNAFDALYPVGSRYITENATCPLATLIPGSTWSIVGTSIITDVSIPASIAVYGNGKQIGMTNGTNNAGMYRGSNGVIFSNTINNDVGTTGLSSTSAVGAFGLTTDTSGKSGIVAKSNSITRTKLTVNIFKRTA